MGLYEDIDLKVFPAGETDGIPVKFDVIKEKVGEYLVLAMGKYGFLHFRIAYLTGCSIWFTRFVILEKMRLRVTAPVSCTFLWVAWKNDLHYSINNSAEKKLKIDHYNLCHLPDINWEINFREPGDSETFNLIFTDTGLEEWMRTSALPDLLVLKDKINRGEMTFLHPEHHRLPHEAGILISKLIRGPYEFKNRQKFYDKKALDLLYHVLRDIAGDPVPQSYLHPLEVERLNELRYMIEQDPGNSYQLKELAETAGMNERKLQVGFKQLFKTAVFEYINEMRMHRALYLLREKNYYVKEVAAMTGYKYPSNFTQAFTSFFGFLPSKANEQ